MKTLVFVDDEADLLDVYEIFLLEIFNKDSQVNFKFFNNPLKAKDFILNKKDNRDTFIFSDIKMPECSGISLYENCRHKIFNENWAFISGDSVHYEKEYKDIKFFHKPIGFEEFSDYLSKLLKF